MDFKPSKTSWETLTGFMSKVGIGLSPMLFDSRARVGAGKMVWARGGRVKFWSEKREGGEERRDRSEEREMRAARVGARLCQNQDLQDWRDSQDFAFAQLASFAITGHPDETDADDRLRLQNKPAEF